MIVHSLEVGEMAEEARRRGVRVTDSEDGLPETCDAIVVQAAATSALEASPVRPPDEDPTVEVVLAAVPALVGPGEHPTLTATIRNHGPVAIWVSADDAPALAS